MEENKELEKQTVFKEDEEKGRANHSSSTEPGGGNKQTALGLDENIAGALAYLFWFITGIIFLLIEKENQFVRFHAMQAIVFFGVYFIITLILGFIPIIGFLISLFMAPVGLVIAIFLMYKAYKEEKFKLPFIGNMAEQFLNR